MSMHAIRLRVTITLQHWSSSVDYVLSRVQLQILSVSNVGAH